MGPDAWQPSARELERRGVRRRQRLRELLGVHALGHLGPGEDAAVRAHLDGCADCRAELAELAPLRRRQRIKRRERVQSQLAVRAALR